MTPEAMVAKYLAACRMRRDLASILGDEEWEMDARDAEMDAVLALQLIAAGLW